MAARVMSWAITVALALAALVPFLVGLLVGTTVRAALWCWSAAVAGYRMGRGA